MPNIHESVRYGPYGGRMAEFQHSLRSSFSHAEISDRIRRAISAAGLWVLAEVDAQALVRRGGFVIGGALQILAFHPRYLVRILAADSSALLTAPLKFAILELSGGEVAVSWINQTAAMARFGRPTLVTLGKELDALCDAIIKDALS